MYVLGVSGSPTYDANTDRLVKEILDSTSQETEFVKLSEICVGPCTACMECVYTNECVIEDDFRWLGEKVLRADALVMGSPTYYGSVSAFTKAFMERMYAFRHLRLLTRGKVGAVVAVGSANEQMVADHLSGWMRFAGMDVVGSLTAKGTICCMVCGPGEGCAYATWNAYCEEFAGEDFGLEKAYEGYFEVLPDNRPYVKGSARIIREHRRVEDEPEIMELAGRLGRRIGDSLKSRDRPHSSPTR